MYEARLFIALALMVMGGCERDGLGSRSTTRALEGLRRAEHVSFRETDTVRGQEGQSFRNSRAELNDAPIMELTEELRIGAVVGRQELSFFRIASIDVASDGSIYVLDAGSKDVRVFDGRGEFRRRFGREGTGPGEFRFPVALAVARDTVLVFAEEPATMLHIFAANGELLAPGRFELPDRLNFNGVSGTRQGWLMNATRQVEVRNSPGRPSFDSTVVASFQPGRERIDQRVLVYPHTAKFAFGDRERPWTRPRFMAASPTHAIGRDGGIYVHQGSDYRIEIRSQSGLGLRQILGDVDRIPVTDEDLDQGLRAEVRRLRSRGERGEGARLIRAIERDARRIGRAEHRPILGRMLASADGHLLIGRLDLNTDVLSEPSARTWDLLDPGGRIVGRLITGSTRQLRRFEWPFVYAIDRDTLNVQYVTKLRISIP